MILELARSVYDKNFESYIVWIENLEHENLVQCKHVNIATYGIYVRALFRYHDIDVVEYNVLIELY